MTRNFYDSYAIIEFLKGNPSFQKWFSEEGITTFDNLMEAFYVFVRTGEIKKARLAIHEFKRCIIDVELEDIEPAMLFKFEHRKNNISYIDAMGYVVARRLGVRFLTGDIAFQSLPNVEFVK